MNDDLFPADPSESGVDPDGSLPGPLSFDEARILDRIDARATARRRRRTLTAGAGVGGAALLTVAVLAATVGLAGHDRPTDVLADGPTGSVGLGVDTTLPGDVGGLLGEATDPSIVMDPTLPTTTGPATGATSPVTSPRTTASIVTEPPLPTQPTVTQRPIGDPCANRTPTRIPVPTQASLVGVAVASDGTAWIATTEPSVLRRTPAGTFSTFSLTGAPSGITVASDGTPWFTEAAAAKVGRITASGQVQELPLPTTTSNPMGMPNASSNPTAIVAGANGSAWFVETSADKVGRVTPSGTITEVDLPGRDSVHANPEGLAIGADGAVWVTEVLTDRIARIDPATLAVTEKATGASGEGRPASGFLSAPVQGRVWTNDVRRGGVVGMATDGAVTSTAIAADSNPGALAAGPDGTLWIALEGTGRLAKTDSLGQVHVQAPFGPADGLRGTTASSLATGAGALWVALPSQPALLRFSCS